MEEILKLVVEVAAGLQEEEEIVEGLDLVTRIARGGRADHRHLEIGANVTEEGRGQEIVTIDRPKARTKIRNGIMTERIVVLETETEITILAVIATEVRHRISKRNDHQWTEVLKTETSKTLQERHILKSGLILD